MGCLVIQLIPFRRSPFALTRSLRLLFEHVLPDAEVAIAGILRRVVLHEVSYVVFALIVSILLLNIRY